MEKKRILIDLDADTHLFLLFRDKCGWGKIKPYCEKTIKDSVKEMLNKGLAEPFELFKKSLKDGK